MTREEILAAAKSCVCGDRDKVYGKPEYSFGAIADFRSDYLRAAHGILRRLTATDVATMMVLFKMARNATGENNDDNWVDAAGYAACGGEIAGGDSFEHQTGRECLHA